MKGDNAIALKVTLLFQIRLLLIASPFIILLYVVGIVVVVLYGLCSSTCSYGHSEKSEFNYGMAVLIFTLQILTMLVTVANVATVLRSCKRFNVSLQRTLGKVCSQFYDSQSDTSCDQKEQDVYNLQKWRVSVHHDVDFPRVRQYLQESRQSLCQQPSGPEVNVIQALHKTTSAPDSADISSISTN